MRALFLALLFTVLSGLVAEANAQEQFTHCTIEPFEIPDDPPYPERPADPNFNDCVAALPAKRMHPNRADSDCIGSLDTPLCTLETYLACSYLRDKKMCEKLGDRFLPFVKGEKSSVKYRIVRIQAMEPEDFPQEVHHLPWAQVGVWEVDTHEVKCGLHDLDCQGLPNEAHHYMYTRVLKKVDGLWTIVSWSDWTSYP